MIKIACVGAGYFAPFHLEAWSRIPEVQVMGLCDHQPEKAKVLANQYQVPGVFTDFQEMIETVDLDVVDIITPPATHLSLCQMAFKKGLDVICQKPLAPSLAEAKEMLHLSRLMGRRLIVHENFRFQPWYRKIKALIQEGKIGDRLHQIYFRMRTGDGWPADAYQDRQPYFRSMPRLLIFETGIHFIDTFRFLGGEISAVDARLRRLNPGIKGEDAALLVFEFQNGALGIWDANRYNEPNGANPRYTFGEMLVEGNQGSIRLYQDGRISLQSLGQRERDVPYHHEQKNFAGDCVYFAQRHYVEALLKEQAAETEGQAYLNNLELQEKIYQQKNRVT